MRSPLTYTIICIGVGGAIGAVMRFGITSWISMEQIDGFPLGTLICNLMGCFLIGWLSALGTDLLRHHTHIRFGLMTGCIGSFTTFSSLSIEGIELLLNQHYVMAGLYTAMSWIGGLSLCAIGWALGHRRIIGKEV